jgi:hypothetical protein
MNPKWDLVWGTVVNDACIGRYTEQKTDAAFVLK